MRKRATLDNNTSRGHRSLYFVLYRARYRAVEPPDLSLSSPTRFFSYATCPTEICRNPSVQVEPEHNISLLLKPEPARLKARLGAFSSAYSPAPFHPNRKNVQNAHKCKQTDLRARHIRHRLNTAVFNAIENVSSSFARSFRLHESNDFLLL